MIEEETRGMNQVIMLLILLILYSTKIAYSSQIFTHDFFANAWYLGNKVFITNTHIANSLEKNFFYYHKKKNYLFTISQVYDLGDDMCLIFVEEKREIKPIEVGYFKEQEEVIIRGYYYYSPFYYTTVMFRINYNPLTNEQSENWTSWFGVATYGYSGSGVFENNKLIGLISCIIPSHAQVFATMITKKKYDRIKKYL